MHYNASAVSRVVLLAYNASSARFAALPCVSERPGSRFPLLTCRGRGRLMRRRERPPLFHLVQHLAYMCERVVCRVAHHSVVLAFRNLAHVVAFFYFGFRFGHFFLLALI